MGIPRPQQISRVYPIIPSVSADPAKIRFKPRAVMHGAFSLARRVPANRWNARQRHPLDGDRDADKTRNLAKRRDGGAGQSDGGRVELFVEKKLVEREIKAYPRQGVAKNKVSPRLGTNIRHDRTGSLKDSHSTPGRSPQPGLRRAGSKANCRTNTVRHHRQPSYRQRWSRVRNLVRIWKNWYCPLTSAAPLATTSALLSVSAKP